MGESYNELARKYYTKQETPTVPNPTLFFSLPTQYAGYRILSQQSKLYSYLHAALRIAANIIRAIRQIMEARTQNSENRTGANRRERMDKGGDLRNADSSQTTRNPRGSKISGIGMKIKGFLTGRDPKINFSQLAKREGRALFGGSSLRDLQARFREATRSREARE